MEHESQLSEVLSEFARTLITDFPIQGILDQLVALTDLRASDDRFPDFASAAVEAGLAAVFAFPMRHGDSPLGALDLYRDTVGMLDARDMEVAQTLADVAAAYVLNARGRADAAVAMERSQHASLHDSLTGLPNRALLHERLVHAGEDARRSHANVAVLFADLDRFKAVNDTYGHRAGDELLCAVGARLKGVLRPGDTLARISGDEFVILCERVRSASDIDVITSRIRDAFREPFVVSEVSLTMSVSIGVAFAGPGDAISSELIDEADAAMYRAKARGARPGLIDLRDTAGNGSVGSIARDLVALERSGGRTAPDDESPVVDVS